MKEDKVAITMRLVPSVEKDVSGGRCKERGKMTPRPPEEAQDSGSDNGGTWWYVLPLHIQN
jgi:hypothetical protein